MDGDTIQAAPEQAVGSEPVTRKEILGWCMYDVADSAFTTVIVTALFAPYFSKIVVQNPGRADFLWGMAASVSELVVAILAPVLGAVADFSGSRKKFLAVCAATIFFFTAALWFVGPGAVGLGLTLYVIANIGFAGGGVFIDSFLPGISNDSNAGRISGTKWAMGYFSGLLCTVIVTYVFPLAKNIVSDASPEQVSKARLIPVVVAIYYGIAVIPTFLFLKERSVPKQLPAGESYLSVGFRQLFKTVKDIRRYRELFKLLIAFLVYNDGIVTVIYFAALFATTTIGFKGEDVALLFILMNVVAAAGAFAFGWVADRIGQKRTILISLVLWIVAVVIAYLSHSKEVFYIAAVFVSLGMGSSQSVTRSLLALFTPKENAAEFFGFLGIAGKALAFLGPMVFGAVSSMTGSQRPAILAIGVFFVAGIIMVLFVDEEKGKAAARQSV